MNFPFKTSGWDFRFGQLSAASLLSQASWLNTCCLSVCVCVCVCVCVASVCVSVCVCACVCVLFVQDIPLAKLAGMVLQDICGQVWLREQCLRHSDLVCSKEILLDPVLKPAQVPLSKIPMSIVLSLSISLILESWNAGIFESCPLVF